MIEVPDREGVWGGCFLLCSLLCLTMFYVNSTFQSEIKLQVRRRVFYGVLWCLVVSNEIFTKRSSETPRDAEIFQITK
jgi:hypothetical protein